MTFLKSVTGGILANIPLKLVLQEKAATKPTDGTPVTVYIVSLEFDGDLEELQQRAHQIALDRATTHLSIEHIEAEARRVLSLLPPDAALPGDIAEDVVAEFYPEQNDREAMLGVLEAQPPRPTAENFAAKDEKSGPSANEPANEPPNEPPAKQPAATSAAKPDNAEELPAYVTDGPEPGEEGMPSEGIADDFPGSEEEIPYEEEGPKLYELSDEVGEVFKLPVTQLLETFSVIFKNAAARGFKAWRDIATDNQILVTKTLPAEGHKDVSDAIILAWRSVRPQEGAAAPQGNGKAPTRAATPPVTRPPPTRPRAPARASGDEPVRADVWDRPSFAVPRPQKPDNAIDFVKLRDVMVAIAGQARSIEELAKFQKDNEQNMGWLLGYNPRYAVVVEGAYKQIAEKLKG